MHRTMNCARKQISDLACDLRGNSSTRIVMSLAMFLLCSLFASSQTLTTLHDFGGPGGDGANPQAGVVFDQAGNMYGTAALGGKSSSDGIIFQLQGGTETILHRFGPSPAAAVPVCRLVLTGNGVLYGTTLEGGAHNMGTVFGAYPPTAPGNPWTEKILYSFGATPTDGTLPNAGVIAGRQDHVLYGVTSAGGTNRRGTVFQLAPGAHPTDPWVETVLYNFAPGGDAAFPSSELSLDQDGNLFGSTLQGGANNVGAIYKLARPLNPGDPWTESVIYSFSGPDGSSPFGRLLVDVKGVIWATTSGGGSGQAGTVYQLIPPGKPGDPWAQTVLYNFSGGQDGGSPEAGVVMDQRGRLFGTARTGGKGGPDFGGVVFVLNPPEIRGDPWRERALVSFGGPNGFGPTSTLVLRSDGIYGTTTQGGAFGKGTVFQLTQ